MLLQLPLAMCHRGNHLCEMSVRILTRQRAPAGCDAANRQEFASMGDEGALENIDLTVRKGELVGILGRVSAGKGELSIVSCHQRSEEDGG
ncbi:hypothetical protein SCLCIDRAFT_1043760 [Scleroderma citrinum Foug A]|uniref:ABC transporter domain-containing protein n=1 Tax=Scleroderma citrinum Foug A TaxID=1036808 RepID=A0A0C2ZB24_9AGAM|nr:hypothetical protein SCLCIDRAFT_1043760 [Scleroderma citrinum Foug A]